jgi:hypothetical protein
VELCQEKPLTALIKPEDGNQGKGVTVNLTSEAEVREAYAPAAEYGRVLVERHVQGRDFRVLVDQRENGGGGAARSGVGHRRRPFTRFRNWWGR